MPTELFKQCTDYLDTITEIFKQQNRSHNFIVDYQEQINHIGAKGKGRQLLDVIGKINEHVEHLNLDYLGPLNKIQKQLYTVYADGLDYSNIETLSPDELNCLKIADSIRHKTPTPSLIKLASSIELEFFDLIIFKSI